MRLVRISRYPVKSLQGESLSVAEVEANGLHGDRCWGIRDEATGRILTARRAPELLFARATLHPDGTPVIALPTGDTCQGPGAAADRALSDWLAKPVRLVSSLEGRGAHAEYFADPTDDTSEAIEWTMPVGRFVDAQPLLVLTTASVRTAAALHPTGDWDLDRFRANLVVDTDEDGWLEDSWCATSTLRIGDVRLQPEQLCIRCTMVTRPQPGLGDDREIFRTLARHHGAQLGAWTAVERGGVVHVGDEVIVEPLAGPTSVEAPLVAAQRGSDEDRRPLDLA